MTGKSMKHEPSTHRQPTEGVCSDPPLHKRHNIFVVSRVTPNSWRGYMHYNIPGAWYVLLFTIMYQNIFILFCTD